MAFDGIRTAVACVALSIVAVTAGVAQATSPQTVQEIALYKGADRQAVLEAGARKEGRVQVYGIDTQTESLYDAFQKDYPFIKIDLYRNSDEDVTRRLMEEYKAGRYTADVLIQTLGGLHVIRDAGYLQPFYSPETEHFRPDAIEPGGHWVNVHESYNGLGWNTKYYSEKDVPQTYDDLLDPKWKGKFSVSGRGATLSQWVGVIVLEKGEDFFRRLGAQNFTLHTISARALANLVISGEVPLSPTIFSAHTRNDQKQGASVAWRPLGAVFSNNTSVSMPAKSNNPFAAMLVIDFMLSKEGQKLRQDLGYASPRLDMAGADKPTKVYQLPERPNFEQENAHWDELIQQVFKTK